MCREDIKVASSSAVGGAQGAGQPALTPEEAEELLNKVKRGLKVLSGDPAATREDIELWLTLGPHPDRKFPDFTDVEGETKKIRGTLLDESREAKRKRRGVRAKMFLERDPDRDLEEMGGSTDPLLEDANTIQHKIKPELMGKYFERAKATLANPGGNKRGVPHDKKDAWLPGVFLTDEIFRALLTEVYEKIDTWITTMTAEDKAKLDSFVKAINAGVVGKNSDADKYLPFFNHHKNPIPGGVEPEDETYIKFVEEGGTILGAIVQVGDWAGGSHSNGSAIHYPDK